MNTILATPRHRTGLTLIEVLSAIGVAAIGVFGILVLVPLASRMSQIGISNEATRQNASNVIEKAKSFGALNTNRWVRWDAGLATYVPVAAMPQGAYCLDPMLISAPNLNPALPQTNTQLINVFPYTSGPATVGPTDRVSLRRAVGTTVPIGAALAESMMGQRDLLRTVEAPSDLLPPTQAFVRDPATGTVMRRETDGSKSALALILPTNRPGSGVQRVLSVVMSNRRFETTNFDRVFVVRDPVSVPPTFISKPGGVMDFNLLEVDFDAGNNERPVANLKSRGWLILVPWYRNALNLDVYAWEHARPYQIRSSDPVPNLPNPPVEFNVSVVGMPYTAPSVATLGGVYLGDLTPMGTRAIYIADAVDMRETEVRVGTAEY